MTREEDFEQAIEDVQTVVFNLKPDKLELDELIRAMKDEAGID